MLNPKVVKGIKQLNVELEDALGDFSENPTYSSANVIKDLSDSICNVCALYNLHDCGIIDTAEYFTKDGELLSDPPAHPYNEPISPFTRYEAVEWVDGMETVLSNGSIVKGAHWTMEQTSTLAKSHSITWDKFPPYVFWACMNMIYSDYCEVAKKYGCDNTDFYVDMSLAFLLDVDGGGATEKLSEYYYDIVIPAKKR